MAESEKPDPSEVEAIDAESFVHQRDSDGNLIPEQAVVEVGGEWHRIEHKPPTKGFLGRIQNEFGDRAELEFAELDGLLSDFYVDPDYDDDQWDDVAPELYTALIGHMVETAMNDMEGGLSAELTNQIEERQSGNPA